MSDEETNAPDTEGKKPNTPTEEPPKTDKPVEKTNPLDRIEAANKEKKALLDQEEKILERREKLAVYDEYGGKAITGQPETPEDKAAARIKAIGMATGAQWAKKM